MIHVPLLLGFATGSFGCLSLYLASPNQRLRSAPWPSAPAKAAGIVALILSWLAYRQGLQALTTSFVLATQLVLLWALLPYLGAWRQLRREPAA